MRDLMNSGVDWIGDVPKSWTLAKLKRFVFVHNGMEVPEEVEPDSPGAIPVYGSGGVFKYTNRHQYDGDAVLFGRKGTLGKPLFTSGKVWIVDTMYFITHAQGLLPRYNFYQLSAFDWKPWITHTAIPSILASDIVDQKFIFPSLSEQERIVGLLDHMCANIDKVIEATKQSIEEYKKLKQSIITKAVTKGIRNERLMKESGIEWVGDIPNEWSTQRIKTLFAMRDEKNNLPLSDVNLISLYTDKGVVQHSDLQETTGNKATNADGYKIVAPNDIIVNIILAWMGAIGRCAYHGVTSPAYDIYIPLKDTNSKYYHYYFRTKGFSGDCFKKGKGIMMMRWRTYSDGFRDIRVVYPPIQEQKEIVDYLDQKCNEIDSLISSKERFITELKSYKQSLIFEYITGKREAIV